MPQPPGTTRSLAAWAANVALADLPSQVREHVKALVLDFLRAVVIGSRTPWGISVRRLMQSLAGPAQATVMIFGDRNDAARAAFVNGCFAHAADIDDTHVGAMLHPGAAVLPAAFATAELVGASGPETLAAIVAGYEAAIRVSLSIQPSHFQRGFQATGTCGVFGAAVAASRLFNHDPETLAATMGTAGSAAGALAQFYYSGSSVKRIHGGRAAEAGVMAALLANAGVLGPADVLEGKAGFAHGYADEFKPELLTDRLGSRFTLSDVSVKPHATGGRSQAAVQAAFDLVHEHAIAFHDIADVELVIPRFVAGRLTNADPPDCTAAQMSLPFTLALAFFVASGDENDRFLDVADYQAHLDDDRVRGLSARVRCTVDDALDELPGEPAPSHLRVWLPEGRLLEMTLGQPHGVLPFDDAAAMLRSVTRGVLPKSSVDDAVAAVRDLDGAATVGDVVRSFVAVGA